MKNPLKDLGTMLAGISGARLSKIGSPPVTVFNHPKKPIVPRTGPIIPVHTQKVRPR